jgi:hypothetical protein
MTALVFVVIAAVCGAAYLVAGMRIAGRPYVTRQVQQRCERHWILAEDHVDEWRREAAFEALFVTAIWPLYLGVRSLISRVADGAPLSDYELRRQLAERDRRIAELERDLGVGTRRRSNSEHA